MADALATLAAMFQVNSSDEVQPIRMKPQPTMHKWKMKWMESHSIMTFNVTLKANNNI